MIDIGKMDEFKVRVLVQYENMNYILEAIVIKSGKRELPSLMGRDWLEKLNVQWKTKMQIEQISHLNTGKEIVEKLREISLLYLERVMAQ